MATPATAACPRWTRRLLAELMEADRRAYEVAKGLSEEQLNWRAAPGGWSVGQCLEHLRQANEVYLPAIAKACEGKQGGATDEIALGRLSSWFIRNYVGPNSGGKRARAPKKIEPAAHVGSSVVEAFVRSNQLARDLVQRASAYDVNRIRFRNPFVPLLRFTVGTGLEIVTQHQKRHLRQAEAVRQNAAFPAGPRSELDERLSSAAGSDQAPA